MLSFHNTCLSIKAASELDRSGICRGKCIDPELKQRVSKKISNREDILFLGNDISEPTKKSDYCMYIHGITPCGTKTTVVVSGIEPYIDIGVNPGETDGKAHTRISNYIMDINDKMENDRDMLEISRTETISAKDFMFYKHENSQMVRVYFKSLHMLSKMAEYCNKRHIKTFSNSSSSYYRVVARRYEINLSGWNILHDYKKIGSGSKAEYIFEVDVRETQIVGIQSDDELYDVAGQHGYKQSVVRYENMIMASFDIEMIPHDLNNFPDAENCPKDEIFMISMTFHLVKRKESLLNVVLTLKETKPIKDAFVIHCRSEACLLLAFSKLVELIQPDFITEFNGGGFDWKQILKKAQLDHVLESFLEHMSIMKLASWEKTHGMKQYMVNGKSVKLFSIGRCYNMREIKIGGATAPARVRSLKLPGWVGFDTLVVFKQLEPNADSHKLNECLRRCNLGSKDDMDIREMFKIYRSGTAEQMKMVAHYCYIDTFKLQQLLIKKNVVQDHREIANLSFTSISDTFMCAGGSRMRNLLMNRAEKRGYVFDTSYKPVVGFEEDSDDDSDDESTHVKKRAKFPGAFVVPPKKGIVKPIMRLDEFADRFEGTIDKSRLDEGYKYIEKNFERIYHSSRKIDNPPEFIKPYIQYTNENENQYPVSGLDYSSLYPSIIMTYNISPEKLIVDEKYAKQLQEMGKTLQFVQFPFCGEMVKAWFVRHNNIKSEYSICGSLLIELFNRRANLKKVLKKLNDRIFELEQEMKPYIAKDDVDSFPKIEEYNEVKFDQVSCDSKQRAVKIFMNTLYGSMGETTSFICAIEVAASVTTMGKYNLMLARDFVINTLKMRLYYGDTDSLYVACNKKYFIDYDRDYFTNKIDKLTYGSKLVMETFNQIEIAKTKVNEHLIADNGSKHLSMAYEEVLYPVAFLSKKKYYGVPHEKNVDFYPKNLFLRGLEIVKRGSSDVLKDIVSKMIREVMDIRSTKDIMDVLKEAIQRFFTTKWPVEVFAKSKVYRADKNNTTVKTMIAKYNKMNYPNIPEQNVRFKTVICKYFPWEYNINGTTKSKLSIGDRMELVERVVAENLEIDLDYYFENELTGQMARLISFCDIFQDAAKSIDEEEDVSSMTEIQRQKYDKKMYKKTEEMLFKVAKKYINGLSKEYSNSYTNKNTLYVDTWKQVAAMIKRSPHLLPFNKLQLLVISILKSKNVDRIGDDMYKWAESYIIIDCNTKLTSDQKNQLREQMSMIEMYIKEQECPTDIVDPLMAWQVNIVKYIYDEYDYKGICDNNMPYNKLEDVMCLYEELEGIMCMPELYPKFELEHTQWIIDMLMLSIASVA